MNSPRRRDLDGDELAQEGAEGLGILTSDRTQVFSAAEDPRLGDHALRKGLP